MKNMENAIALNNENLTNEVLSEELLTAVSGGWNWGGGWGDEGYFRGENGGSEGRNEYSVKPNNGEFWYSWNPNFCL